MPRSPRFSPSTEPAPADPSGGKAGGGDGQPPESSTLDAPYRRLQRFLPLALVVAALLAGGVAALVAEDGSEATEALSFVGISLVLGLLGLLVTGPGAYTTVAVIRGLRRELTWGLVLAGGGSGILFGGFGFVALGQAEMHPTPLLWIEPLSWTAMILGVLTVATLLGARPRDWGKASPGLPGVLLAGLLLGLTLLVSPVFQGSRAKAYEVAVRGELRRLDSAQVHFRELGEARFAPTLETLGLEARSPIRLEIVRADEGGYAARGSFAEEPVGPCAVYRGEDAFRLSPAVAPGAVSCVPPTPEAGIPTFLLAALSAAWLLAAGISAWVLGPASSGR